VDSQPCLSDVILPSQKGFIPENSLNIMSQVAPDTALSLINNWLMQDDSSGKLTKESSLLQNVDDLYWQQNDFSRLTA